MQPSSETEPRWVALVTGAYGAIGLAIARALALRPGSRVVLAGRDERRLAAAVDALRSETGNAAVHAAPVDLSRRGAVAALAASWEGPLHVLVNNAATTPRRRQVTPDGLEAQFATNVMGYFWMTSALLPVLRRSSPARVVNVASYWAGDLDLDDLQFERRRYDNDTAYRQSKQANRMLTAAFAERLGGAGVTVNACHPGDVNSKLSNSLGFGGSQSPEQGADTPVWLATSAECSAATGLYFARRRPERCPFAADRAATERLYQICAALA